MPTLATRRLPRRDVTLTALGLGGAPLGGLYRAVGEAQARETIVGAWQAGVRYFDTAPYYGYGASELRVGAALRELEAGDAVISTKVGRLLRPRTTPQAADDTWIRPLPFEPHYDYTGAGILRSFEDSQQRLGIDRIDILLIHDIGRLTHGADDARTFAQLVDRGGFAALDELRRSGRVRAVGIGVNEVEVVERVMAAFDMDCVLLAGRYTLLEQGAAPLLARCAERGIGVIVGGAFNSGILADAPAAATGAARYNYLPAEPAIVKRVARRARACEQYDVPLPAAALQFVLAHEAVVSCVTGARNARELRQNVAWATQPLPTAFWDALRRDGLVDPACPVPGSAPSTDPASRRGARG